MPEIVQYVNHGATHITPLVLEKMLRQLPLWKVEFTQISAPQYPHLVNQLEFLADAVEDFAEGADKELPYVAVAEAVFALMYVHKKTDIIPDFVAKLGHGSDSSIVRAVLIQNERVFAAYAARHGLNYSRITSNP
ncbi:MAG: hypothetical protein WCO56_16060 [Verrucomicrobiota bacterium]